MANESNTPSNDKPLNMRIGHRLDEWASALLSPLDNDITYGFKEMPLFSGAVSFLMAICLFLAYCLMLWPVFKSSRTLTRNRRRAEAVFKGMENAT
jgi:hypothetical protein